MSEIKERSGESTQQKNKNQMPHISQAEYEKKMKSQIKYAHDAESADIIGGKNEKEVVNTLLQEANNNIEKNQYSHATQILQRCLENNMTIQEQIKTHILLGRAYHGEKKYDLAIIHYQKSLTYPLVNREKLGIYILLGDAYSKEGTNIQGIIDSYKNAIKYAETNGQKSNFYISLGYAYGLKGNIEGEINAYESALPFADSIYSKNYIYTRIGNSYDFIGNYENAIKYYNIAYNSTLKETNDITFLLTLENKIGNAYKENGNFKKASEYFDRGIQRFEENKTVRNVWDIFICNNIADAIELLNNEDDIKKYEKIIDIYVHESSENHKKGKTMALDSQIYKIKGNIAYKKLHIFFEKIGPSISVENMVYLNQLYKDVIKYFIIESKILSESKDMNYGNIQYVAILVEYASFLRKYTPLSKDINFLENEMIAHFPHALNRLFNLYLMAGRKNYLRYDGQDGNENTLNTFMKKLLLTVKGATYSHLAECSYENKPDLQACVSKDFGDTFQVIETNEANNIALIENKYHKKIFVFRGTHVGADFGSDLKIALNILPSGRVQEGIDFINQHLQKNEKATFTGHSLGGNLAQIFTTMYPENCDETFTFNAPGGKKMSYIKMLFNERYRPFLENYSNNQSSPTITGKIINYQADEFIGHHGKDLGTDIQHPYNNSHSIKNVHHDFGVQNTNSTPTFDKSNIQKGFQEIVDLYNIFEYKETYLEGESK